MMSIFRENQLWTNDIELVYTLNEPGMKVLFKKYYDNTKLMLSMAGYERMLIVDSELPISREDLL